MQSTSPTTSSAITSHPLPNEVRKQQLEEDLAKLKIRLSMSKTIKMVKFINTALGKNPFFKQHIVEPLEAKMSEMTNFLYDRPQDKVSAASEVSTYMQLVATDLLTTHNKTTGENPNYVISMMVNANSVEGLLECIEPLMANFGKKDLEASRLKITSLINTT